MAIGDGLVRLRTNQLGKQTVIGTPVAATVRVPWKGLPNYDPNRTDPDIDTGSIDPVIPPIPGIPTVEWNPTGPLIYNDLQIRHSAGTKGGVASTGTTAKTSVFQVASLTADPFDYYTDEAGDDQSATDGMQCYGGVIDQWSEEMSETDDVLTFSDTWVFAAANLGVNRTGALVVDPNPTFVRADETGIYIDVAPGSIGISPIVDAFHAYTLTNSNNLDRKKYRNGSNSRRKLSGFARGARQIELVLTFAKTAATMAEELTLDDDPVPARYIQIYTTSAVLAAAATPYSYIRGGAFRLYTVTDGEIDGNATKVFTYRAFYDATLGYAFKATVVNTKAV